MDYYSKLQDADEWSPGRRVVSPLPGRFIHCMTELAEEHYVTCLSPSDGGKGEGLEGGNLETISYGEIAAVASHLGTTPFDQMGREDLKEAVLIHQEVNNRIFKTRTVVPVSFGTIADDPVQVKELLQKIYLQVKAALKRLEGKIELAVRASWDLHAILQEAKSEIMIENSGAIDIHQKIAIGRRVFEAMDKRKNTINNAIHSYLYPVAVDFTVRSLDGEEMIFDRSYLVEREKEALFDEAVNFLANELGERVSFKYIGPLPPYSFTRLEIAQGNFETVDEARKTLDLPERASFKEITSSYRRLSLACHPDKNPDDLRSEERFRNVARAYEILEAYCENNRWLEEDQVFSFTRNDVERALMVRSGSR